MGLVRASVPACVHTCMPGPCGRGRAADKDRALWAFPVYARASVLGFTREELDDILQTIQPEDMQGTSSAQEAADRLLSSVYMAVVSDVGETEGLTPQQVSPSVPGSRAD